MNVSVVSTGSRRRLDLPERLVTGAGLLTIRPLEPADLDAVAAAEARIYPFPWTRGNFADSVREGHEFWLMSTEESLAAYCVLMWLPDEIHLLNFSVLPEFQGLGVGRRLLHCLLQAVPPGAVRGMLLEVRPSNPVAQKLYESLGFLRIGVRKRYYPSWHHTREDAIVMLRNLHP